jgi:hypothetical protein
LLLLLLSLTSVSFRVLKGETFTKAHQLTVFPAIAGNVANQVSVTQEYLDDIYKVKNPYSTLMHEYYGTIFPLCMYPKLEQRDCQILMTCRGRDRCRYRSGPNHCQEHHKL